MTFKLNGSDDGQLAATKAVAAAEQPRNVLDLKGRRTLPHANPRTQSQSCLLGRLPVHCRLLIWKHVLEAPHTRLERWRPSYHWSLVMDSGPEVLDAECFPYRLTTAGTEKTGKPLALLLCCRQVYSEALKVLYSSTTFVFESPRDIHSFQLTVSLDGLAHVRHLILAFGRVDWSVLGPLCASQPPYTAENVKAWVDSLTDIHKTLPSLQELQIWLYHHNTEGAEVEQRPWLPENGDDELEQRHQKLFNVFGAVQVPGFRLKLSWNPQDLLSKGEWPFKIECQNWLDISREIDNLPSKTVIDLYD